MSSDFAVDVTENWQSEFLQFFLYIFGTVWLLQRGSPESKELHKAGPESEQEQRIGDHAHANSPAGKHQGLAPAPVLPFPGHRDGPALRAVMARPVNRRNGRLQRTAAA